MRFSRNGGDVLFIVEVAGVCSVDKRYPNFKFSTSDELYAALLTNALNQQFDTLAKEIKRDAYEQGWADAKAKKSKEQYFSRSFAHRFRDRNESCAELDPLPRPIDGELILVWSGSSAGGEWKKEGPWVKKIEDLLSALVAEIKILSNQRRMTEDLAKKQCEIAKEARENILRSVWSK